MLTDRLFPQFQVFLELFQKCCDFVAIRIDMPLMSQRFYTTRLFLSIIRKRSTSTFTDRQPIFECLRSSKAVIESHMYST